ncbi:MULTISPECIES: alanine/glycine:cation symporter family protein [Pontibacillus]|uniref:Alanine/glycine:cation symporter family protein n=1 Tax=Pontibacillus chungwhensis TaxID=265426 RepID=A0ABY8V4Z2_9BACI|nr:MULTISPECIES: alanine/glycine:cation symporter family protein [Pontibacillus]MCD5325749.1 alanine:cation symporter family protein [Pontibacillus sp. HN14]WIG00273.1 alanine/glycine:cation symporter family protein [Pontibacillus chungwhensis]
MEFLEWVSKGLWGYILIAVLLGVGLYFTVITRFIQFRLFAEMFRVLFEKESIKNDGRGTSAFQSFTISTASRVGTGNLGGVALAVSVGGPGAVFWMWIIALLGSATSFVESTLAQVYKVKDEDGYRGGPAYYMEKGLNNRKLGIAFAIIITFTYGLVFSAVQSNTIRLAFEESFSVNKVLMGVLLVIGSAAVIFGGIQRIAKVTQIFIPVMAILYLMLAGYVLITNIGAIPDMFVLIFQNAFGIEEVAGGAFGAAILNGIKRGLFSNEAGMGSAPNAAAAAEVSHPAKQGLIQTLGVFVDTILICSATAFIIISSGDPSTYMNLENAVGIQITQQAFETHIGSWANTFVAIAILFFAFSSIIGNYYYGETNMQFIKNSPKRIFWYRLAALAMVFFGAMAKLDLVWLLADITMGIMALINLYAIVRLSGVAKEVLLDYRSDRKKEHKTKFSKQQIKNKEGISLWE